MRICSYVSSGAHTNGAIGNPVLGPYYHIVSFTAHDSSLQLRVKSSQGHDLKPIVAVESASCCVSFLFTR
ncbi:unnamed protein product, partial [Brassica rapa]